MSVNSVCCKMTRAVARFKSAIASSHRPVLDDKFFFNFLISKKRTWNETTMLKRR